MEDEMKTIELTADFMGTSALLCHLLFIPVYFAENEWLLAAMLRRRSIESSASPDAFQMTTIHYLK